MTRKTYMTLAASGSAALLIAAFFFQWLGWAPCQMCLWQRWPHAAAVVIGIVAYVLPARIFALFGALAALTTAGIAAYHTGVERKWWKGPSSCTGDGNDLGGVSGESLLPGASDVPALVLCDNFEPFLFGLTMANWNVLASLGLAIVWLMALRAKD
jgi:disulfide bond formation protein DsbB